MISKREGCQNEVRYDKSLDEYLEEWHKLTRPSHDLNPISPLFSRHADSPKLLHISSRNGE